MNTEQLLFLVEKALDEKKAKDIKILDVRHLSTITDFMIVASGNTDRQVNALTQYVIQQAKTHGHQPLGEEGSQIGEWALVDLGDIIVHVMQPRIRDFYQLEKLWSDRDKDSLFQPIAG